MNEFVSHHGGCHCRAVRFTVQAPAELVAHECNCSICAMTGYQHIIVPASQFTLHSGEQAIETYGFNTRVARHFFCRLCGIKSFYVPRSNPDGISVNARCLDRDPARSLRVEPFDGRNWEANAHQLHGLSSG